MKYGVSGRDIQLANHLATGNIHERTRLKIPSAQGKVPPEDNQVEVIAALKRLAVSKFKAVRAFLRTESAHSLPSNVNLRRHVSRTQKKPPTTLILLITISMPQFRPSELTLLGPTRRSHLHRAA